MLQFRRLLLFLFCAASALLAPGCANAPWKTPPPPPIVSYHALVCELTDLSALADFPAPAWRPMRASSRDPRSKTTADAEAWFSGQDSGNPIRREKRGAGREECVLMESSAPGVVTRIWADNPAAAGTIRFYFDGADNPGIEISLEKMMAGRTSPFLAPLCGIQAGGAVCMLPIPFARACKITTDKPGMRWQIDYREYAAGANLPTWSNALAAGEAETLGPAMQRLMRPSTLTPLKGGHPRVTPYSTRLAPGAAWERTLWGRNLAIYRLTCRVASDTPARALRGVTIEISFDGHDRPDVIAPLGDFFGAAPGAAPFRTLAQGMQEDGAMYSHWVMPACWRARVRFVNHCTTPVSLSGEIATDRRPRTDGTQYFHAKWRAAFGEPARPARDWTLLRAVGRGRLVGEGFSIANASEQWWGDGDEKVYVDGGTIPALWGTGTADAFGFGETAAAPFSDAYHAVSIKGGTDAARGFATLSRVMLADSAPFQTGLRCDFEILPRDPAAKQDWAAMAYWYADEDAEDSFAAPGADQLRAPTLQ